MVFRNRQYAAMLLAEKLAHYKGLNPLVLAIPRGAVPMAKIIAEQLEGVGDFFQEFSPVTDEEVIDLLREGRSESEKTKSMSEVLPRGGNDSGENGQNPYKYLISRFNLNFFSAPEFSYHIEIIDKFQIQIKNTQEWGNCSRFQRKAEIWRWRLPMKVQNIIPEAIDMLRQVGVHAGKRIAGNFPTLCGKLA